MSKKFEYKYFAPTKEERAEIEDIRKNYIKKDTQNIKMDTLRKLDRKVKNLPTLVGLIVGCVFCLVFGLGLTCILQWDIWGLGITLMVIGFIPMLLNPFIISKLTSYLKNKYRDEILSLSEELLNDKETR